MKQLFFLLLLFLSCPLIHAASASRAESQQQDHRSYHEILGVAHNATSAEIKKAYHNLALTYHPDKYRNRPLEEQQQAEKNFQKINEAYTALLNPQNQGTSSFSSSESDPQLKKDIEAFISECEQLLSSPWMSSRERGALNNIIQNVRTNRHISTEVMIALSVIKRAQVDNFTKACNILWLQLSCLGEHRKALDELINDVRKSSAISSEQQKRYENVKAAIEQCQKEVEIFIHSCQELRKSPWNSQENQVRINFLIAGVTAQGHISQGMRVELVSIKTAQVQEFVKACGALLKDRNCTAECKQSVENLISKVSMARQITLADQQNYEKVKQNIDSITKKQADDFIQACQQEQSKPWCSRQQHDELGGLFLGVIRSGRVSEDDEKRFKAIKQQQIRDCIECCTLLRNSPHCANAYKDQLFRMIEHLQNVSEVPQENQKIVSQIRDDIQNNEKKYFDDFLGKIRTLSKTTNYRNSALRIRLDTLKELILKAQSIDTKDKEMLASIEAEIKKNDILADFVDQCNTLRDEALHLPYFDIFLNLASKVEKQKCVTAEDQATLQREELRMFIALCHLQMQPWGNSTAHYAELQTLIQKVQAQQRINKADKQMLEKIKQQKKRIFVEQCKNLAQENEKYQGTLPDKEAISKLTEVEADNNYTLTERDQEDFTDLYAKVQKAKSRQNFRDKAALVSNIIAPLTLAFGLGLLNNWLAHQAGGDLKQVHFYKAPAREWLTASIALYLYNMLGRQLRGKLHNFGYFIGKPFDGIFATLCFLSIGLMQNLGERLPLCGTGWRSPINPDGSKLVNVLLANSSLFLGSLGGVAVGLGKVLGR